MNRFLNRFLDASSEFFAHRKGLLPTIGILLVLGNLVLKLIPAGGILVEADILLHLGVIIAVLGIMLAWAL